RILAFRELARSFDVSGDKEDELRQRLDDLERRGEIVRVSGEKYSAIEYSNLIAGRLSVRPEGYGFVLVDGGEDLFVPRSQMHGALDGDRVLARGERPRSRASPRSQRARAQGAPRDRGREDRISGVIVQILERARERVVGRFETEDGRHVVLPYDP